MARITISNAEHTRLVALGDATLRRIVSETTDQIGLGRFVPVNTKADGTPATNTDWFTAHPDNQANAIRALPALKARLQFALEPANVTKMRALVKDVDGSDTKQPITDTERAVEWRAAGGDDAPISRDTELRSQ